MKKWNLKLKSCTVRDHYAKLVNKFWFFGKKS